MKTTRNKIEVACFKCKNFRHYSNECEEEATVKHAIKKLPVLLVLNKD